MEHYPLAHMWRHLCYFIIILWLEGKFVLFHWHMVSCMKNLGTCIHAMLTSRWHVLGLVVWLGECAIHYFSGSTSCWRLLWASIYTWHSFSCNLGVQFGTWRLLPHWILLWMPTCVTWGLILHYFSWIDLLGEEKGERWSSLSLAWGVHPTSLTLLDGDMYMCHGHLYFIVSFTC